MRNQLIINIARVFNILVLFIAVLLLASFQTGKSVPVPIVLKDEPKKIGLAGFSITEVNDATRKPAGFGTVLGLHSNVPVALTFNGSLADVLKAYFDANTVATARARPIRLSVNKLLLSESTVNGKSVDGELQLQFGFDVVTGDQLYKHLVDYKGTLRYTRLANQTGAADSYIRMGIQNSLTFFKDWLEKNKNGNPALANSVKLVFKDYDDPQPEGDTIYYSAKRPLTWDDFEDKVANHGGYTAEVIPGLGFTESNEVKNGQLVVEMRLKVYLPKSAAYVSFGQKNAYNLNHEQRHFDIVKLISQRLKKTLLAEQLPVHNYNGYINVDYFDALRQITAMQKQYDAETVHGANRAQQETWNKKIDAELAGGVSGG